jgi:hypothetical protein
MPTTPCQGAFARAPDGHRHMKVEVKNNNSPRQRLLLFFKKQKLLRAFTVAGA